jgi:NAD-dependent SIR2 family protein deacetylase
VSALDLLTGRPLVVLTGAGVSTDSGIPDYRGAGAPVRTPMTIAEFRSGPAARQRYWARAFLGWSRMGHARPNDAHRALAVLDPELLITQNVDGLHEAAGSRTLVALHGRIAEVVCLDCADVTPRAALQSRMEALNPGFGDSLGPITDRPDFDVELDDTASFVVPGCEACGGLLKPHVVFFGENVPAPTVARCFEAVDSLVETDGALLVAGSSLTVMSGFRFVRRAARAGVPVVIVNRGDTRADDLATYKLDVGVGPWLSRLAGLAESAAVTP